MTPKLHLVLLTHARTEVILHTCFYGVLLAAGIRSLKCGTLQYLISLEHQLIGCVLQRFSLYA